MNKKEMISLKILGLGTTILYGWSFLWISMMYLYGGMYYPINESSLKKYIPFEFAVVTFSTIIIGLVIFYFRKNSFWSLLFQDISLIIISVPLFATILQYFENGFDDPESLKYIYSSIFLLTILIINLNDWVKIKKPTANTV